MIGVVLGQYRIVGTIGKGGMGVVYAGEHTLLHRPAAVKVLLPEYSQDQEIVTRFFNEARAATAIRHPGIVEIYDFGYHVDGSAFIAMERLDGESLTARMARGRMSFASILAIARQLAGALGAAHAKGIVHRDLKPDNVFIVPDPEVPGGERIKLLDFGIAKLAVDQQGHGHTRTGAVMGTPTYMAPEQCRGVSVDHRADLYSIGCLMFELITGRPPFVGEGTGDVLAAHIYLAPPTLASLAGQVPVEIETLVQRLLIKDPAQRIQSTTELVHAIDAASNNAHRTGVGAAPYSTGTGSTHPPTTLSGAARVHTIAPPGGSKIGIVIGAGAVVAAAVAIVLIAQHHRAAESEAASAVTTHPVVAPAVPTPTPPPPAPPPPPPTVAPAVPSTIDVAIESKPSGAELVIDGTVLGKTPYHGTLPRADKTVTVVVRSPGYLDAKLEAPTSASINQTIKLEKPRAHAVTHPTTGRDDSVNPFGN